MELVEHRYSDKPARFYVDGVRVSRARWEALTDRAHREGTLCNLWTRAHPYGQGCTHSINGSTIAANPQR